MLGRLEIAAREKNGRAIGTELAALTQDDALCIWEYWRAEMKRAGLEWDSWYPAGLCSLGYEKEGDKFLDTPNVQVKAECIVHLWNEYYPEASGKLDAYARTRQAGGLSAFKPKEFAPAGGTSARFKRVATVVWEKLKRDRGGITPPPPPSGPDWWVLAALGYLAYLAWKEVR
jgi:hypothetical protein